MFGLHRDAVRKILAYSVPPGYRRQNPPRRPKLEPFTGVVMDVMMPKKDGVEACREIMESAPETRVLMLTASTEEDAIVEAVAAGATGYLQKETGREQLLSAVRNVALGNLRLPTESVRRAFEAVRGGGRTADAPAGLTSREREILVSFAQGMSYARIAQARGIKPVTARNAIYAIQRKLGSGRGRDWCSGACETDCWMTSSSRQSLKRRSIPGSGRLQPHRYGRHSPSAHTIPVTIMRQQPLASLPRPSTAQRWCLPSNWAHLRRLEPVGRSARPVLRSTSDGGSVASESCCNLCNCGRIQIDRP